jgi:hypothetical protein
VILAIPRKPSRGAVEWRRWFAWYPVRVTGDYICWLEFIERSRLRWAHEWLYRFTDTQFHRVKAPF